MKYYHGTAACNLNSILKHGLKAGEGKLWDCSGFGVYLWPEDESQIETSYKEKPKGFIAALFSATPSLIRHRDGETIVVEVELDEKLIVADKSCMHISNPKVYNGDIDVSKILTIEKSSDYSLWLPLMGNWLISNDLLNKKMSKANAQISKYITNMFWNNHPHHEEYGEKLLNSLEWETVFARELELV